MRERRSFKFTFSKPFLEFFKTKGLTNTSPELLTALDALKPAVLEEILSYWYLPKSNMFNQNVVCI